MQEDEQLLEDSALSTNKRNAIVVRLGEKRILQCTLERTQALQASSASGAEKKRKESGTGKNSGGSKKSKRWFRASDTHKKS